MILLRLAYEFFKTGLFAVGGGLATLPFLYAMSATTGWFSTAEIANMIAISESTPGAMGVNMSTYVGYTTAGVLGSIVGPLGLVFPSIVIIVIISKIINKFKESQTVQDIFYGLRPASTALIASAGLGVAKITLIHPEFTWASGNILNLFNYKVILLAAAVFLCMKKFKKIHPIAFIAASAVIGVVLQF